jgi:hypothetical protein
MHYTVRAFIGGRDEKLDSICKTFCSMERTAYNLLRDDVGTSSSIKATLRARYSVKNARWIQSAVNQAKTVMASQEEGVAYRIEMYEKKIKNSKEGMKRLSNPMKVQGCERKLTRLQTRLDELKAQLVDRSYPKAVFGSRKLHHRLSIARGERRKELLAEWKERRSNHFFSVGQANQRGNGNTRLSYDGVTGSFQLGVRNWPGGSDFSKRLQVPEHWGDTLKKMIGRSESAKLGSSGALLEGSGGLPYSVRVIRSEGGYQVLVSFGLEEPLVQWSGRTAGIDINPEGIGCTIVSADGNLMTTRSLCDSRFITASVNKRKWLLENTVLRMLRWCRDTHGCNAIALEGLRFKGAYDFSSRTNFKLSNFMRRKMLQRIGLSALKMGVLSVEVDPAYSSKVAVAKYGRRFGGFNRHQLAAFVTARRALAYGEAPIHDCLPKTRKERAMWNHCVRYYGHRPLIQTLLRREPLEWKSGGDANGGGAMMTKLLTAPPAITSSQTGSSHSPLQEGAVTSEMIIRRAGRVRPNGQASRGDGARGHRVSPPDVEGRRSADIFDVNEDNVIC